MRVPKDQFVTGKTREKAKVAFVNVFLENAALWGRKYSQTHTLQVQRSCVYGARPDSGYIFVGAYTWTCIKMDPTTCQTLGVTGYTETGLTGRMKQGSTGLSSHGVSRLSWQGG